jgi:hypothetical protein
MTACVAELKPFRQFIARLRLFWVPRHQKAIRKIASKMGDNSPEMAGALVFVR